MPPERAPIPRQSLRTVAEAAIREAILNHSLLPGERLNDKDLQKWLGISRAPLREALHGLELQGLVEISAQAFTRVAVPTPELIGDIVETIGLALAGAVLITVPAIPPEAANTLSTAIDNTLAAVHTQHPGTHLHAAIHFYDLLLTLCPNRTLVEHIEGSLTSMSYQYRANISTLDLDWPLIHESWQDIQIAIRNRDGNAAELAVKRMHLIRTLHPEHTM